MRIVLASNNGGPEGVAVARRVTELGHDVVAFVQDGDLVPRHQRSRVQMTTPLDRNLRLLALQEGVPILWLERKSTAGYDLYRQLAPDLLLVSCFSKIFDDDFLGVAKIGNINVHPALLPRHRGAHPHAHVIMQSETETGISFHAISSGIDAGDILHQERLAVSSSDTSETLRERCSELATAALAQVLEGVALRGVSGAPQDEKDATYEPRFTRKRARIDWAESADHIERQVRAAVLHGNAWFTQDGARVLVEECRIGPHVDATPGAVLATRPSPIVATSCGTLEILDAQIAPPEDDDGTIYATVPWPNHQLRKGDQLSAGV